MGKFIQTYSGVEFYPLSPQVEDINIVDVAHAQSHICRYTGHCRKFYSVAEHSRRAADQFLGREPSFWGHIGDVVNALVCKWSRGYVKHNLLANSTPWQIQLAKYGLIHDSSEAYLSDIARPLKEQDEYAKYRENEAFLQGMIYSKHGMDPKEPRELKEVDYRLCNTERKALMPPIYCDEFFNAFPPYGGKFRFGWRSWVAKLLWLDMYYQLFGGL